MLNVDMNVQTEEQGSTLRLPSQALKVDFQFDDTSSSKFIDSKDVDTKVLHAFQIEQIGLLLPETIISELLEDMSTCRLPNTSPVLYGMGNLRGRIIPIFDLHYLFDMPRGDKQYFLVIGSDENTVAVLLNALPLQVRLSESEKLNSLPPIPDILRAFTRACYESDGLWLECDLFAFFMKIREQLN